jgi:3-hydroxybutyrate dehydrogenase
MLKGKAAIVTGSTSGIGRGIAHALAKEGCNIMLNGFADQATIDTVKKEVAAFGVKAEYNAADMTKPEQIADMVAATVKTFGSIDVLINNAGIQHVAPVDEFPIDKWNAIIAINLSSSFHTIRAALPYMKKQGWGRIVQIASAHALVASPFKSAYVAAKHGIAGLTKTVALEVAQKNITCNAICPGYAWTPLVSGQIADTAKARNMTEEQVKNDVILAAQPTKQFVSVEQIADLAVYLCGDSAANITGTLLSIDGGWTAA